MIFYVPSIVTPVDCGDSSSGQHGHSKKRIGKGGCDSHQETVVDQVSSVLVTR